MTHRSTLRSWFASHCVPALFETAARYHYRRLAGELERELPTLVSMVCPGTVAFDIGANIGLYAYALARVGARVHSVEPLPQCHRALFGLARLMPSVSVHSMALGDRDGQLVLYIPVRGGRPETSESSARPGGGPHECVDVPVTTLDSLAARVLGPGDVVSVIKIDVEGHEDAVLDGGAGTLRRFHPVVLVEVEARHRANAVEECFRRLVGLGYVGRWLDAERHWRALSAFDVERDQVPFEPNDRRYVNMFFFERSDRP